MKIPLSWLKDYIDVELPPEKISDILTMAGLEVDKIEKPDLGFSGVVVAKIVSIAPHPNAERLRILTVFDGQEQFQIVCGDLTCVEGQKSALARIGATLKEPDGKTFKIKKSKLRDVESFGMMCSAKELGISSDGLGIMNFPEEIAEGTDVVSLYGDIIFEISLTPNLGHALSVKGIARELAAQLQLKLKKIHFSLKEESTSSASFIQLDVEDPEKCPQYSCRVLKNVKVGPSPNWLKQRLESAGLRSINNVVDVTNYIMLDMGQPMHAFDYDTLEGKKIVVTSTSPYNTLVTLDEKEREIPEGVLLICDENKPLAFAGVMGGLSSSVTENTTTILLEAAHFSEDSVRKSSKTLSLRSESSHRFERGTDRLEVLPALDRAAFLLQEIAGAIVCKGAVTFEASPYSPKKLKCRLDYVNRILGTTLSLSELSSMLNRLEIRTDKEEKDALLCSIPSYRNDITQEVDLIEEAGRIYGFNHIGLNPARHASSALASAPIYLFENLVRERLIAEGLQECLTCDLISPELASLTKETALGDDHIIRVLHPSSVDNSILRASLLPGLLQVVKHNMDRQEFDLSGFEVGRIHFKDGSEFKEPSMVGIILTGKSAPYHFDPKPREVDFYDLKGIVENLLEALHIRAHTFEISHRHNFHPGRQAFIKVKDCILGALGEIHPSHLKMLGIEKRVYFAELNLHDLMECRKMGNKISDLPAYPATERDWTLTLKEETPIAIVEKAIHEVRSSLLEKLSLLDIFTSDRIGKGNKNVTFRFVYRDKNGTISFEDAEREHSKITQEVAKKLADRI